MFREPRQGDLLFWPAMYNIYGPVIKLTKKTSGRNFKYKVITPEWGPKWEIPDRFSLDHQYFFAGIAPSGSMFCLADRWTKQYIVSLPTCFHPEFVNFGQAMKIVKGEVEECIKQGFDHYEKLGKENARRTRLWQQRKGASR